MIKDQAIEEYLILFLIKFRKETGHNLPEICLSEEQYEELLQSLGSKFKNRIYTSTRSEGFGAYCTEIRKWVEGQDANNRTNNIKD